MDYDLPALSAIATAHGAPPTFPASSAPPADTLPRLECGQPQQTFDSIEALLQRVQQLHAVEDPVVAPHRSKYAARIIMTDALALLRPLLSTPPSSWSPAERQWLHEQVGRLECLNGINHIESEEVSAGEKMLARGLLAVKDNPALYPLDTIQGYNHLGIVWSNRNQHLVAHAYLSLAQSAFLRFKKARAAALALCTQQEREDVERADKMQQEAVEEEPAADAVTTAGADATKQASDSSSDSTSSSAGENAKKEQKEQKEDGESEQKKDAAESSPAASAASSSSTGGTKATRATISSVVASHPGYRFLDSVLWHQLEVTHTLSLFFLAQVFGHLKKRDLAALYCHLCLNRQLKQRRDFNRRDWVTNAIGLSFYYAGRKNFQQAHHCLLAAQHFVKDEDMPQKMNTPTADTTPEQMLAADLCRAWGAFYLKWLQRSRDLYIENAHMLLPAQGAHNEDAVQQAKQAAAAAGKAGAGAMAAALSTKDDDGGAAASSSSGAAAAAAEEASDPASSLASLPEEELAELKRLQRLDRERERHFEAAVEQEADEDEDALFSPLQGRAVRPGGEQPFDEQKAAEHVAKQQTKVPGMPANLTSEEQQAVTEELARPESQDNATNAASSAASSSSSAAASSAAPATSVAPLFIEFKSLHLPASPVCVPATSFVSARVLFRQSLWWFSRASMFYILDGYVSDHIPILQDMSLLYKLLAVFERDLSRQCKMHKRRIDLLAPIYKQLSVASYQEFYQQLTDELAQCHADMMELKLFLLHMKQKLLGPGGAHRNPKLWNEKKREDAQHKVNELALKAIQFYQLWLASWSKDGKTPQDLDPYYHRWYLMAIFKCARCYSKIYHTDAAVLNQFVKKSWEQYKLVVSLAEKWHAENVMAEELPLCREMVQLLPHKMDRISAKGSSAMEPAS